MRLTIILAVLAAVGTQTESKADALLSGQSSRAGVRAARAARNLVRAGHRATRNAGQPTGAFASGADPTEIPSCKEATIREGDGLPTTPDLRALGKQFLNYKYQGQDRPYILFLPPGYHDSIALPVIFAFHGGGSDANVFYKRLGRLVRRARNNQIILVFPQGIWKVWNAVGCCQWAHRCQFDDIGYVKELATYLKGALKIDPKRVYSLGYSNGGYLSHRVGAELSQIFAAISVGSGSIGGYYPGESLQTIKAVSPMPVIMHHGKNDHNVSFAGGFTSKTKGAEAGRYTISFAQSVSYWANFNGCDKTPTKRTLGKVTLRKFRRCRNGAEVVAMVIADHGHKWPKTADTGGFNIVDAILAFFQRHPKP